MPFCRFLLASNEGLKGEALKAVQTGIYLFETLEEDRNTS
jgi:hypothetical protein